MTFTNNDIDCTLYVLLLEEVWDPVYFCRVRMMSIAAVNVSDQ